MGYRYTEQDKVRVLEKEKAARLNIDGINQRLDLGYTEIQVGHRVPGKSDGQQIVRVPLSQSKRDRLLTARSNQQNKLLSRIIG
ncbi:hypothetical protein ACFL2C_02465 [Patescibacteria group bacterium]